MQFSKPFSTIYIAKPEYLDELCAELEDVSGIVGDLVFSARDKTDICFALDVWRDVEVRAFNSISEAVALLRQAGKFWYLHPSANVRRSHLIAESLRKLPPLERTFPVTEEIPPIGCFTLLDKNTLLYSNNRFKKWPLGICHFKEDKTHPPNRAYLKLWEALTLLNRTPQPGETTLDLGASPGGWTYVLQSLGTAVTAVDKAPLDPKIARLPHVTYLQQSAFALEPQAWRGKADWLLGDIACYPERLYELVQQWRAADVVRQMILTIKLQGKTNLDIIRQFQAIPNSRTLHLYYNKHEATFFYPW